MDEENRGGVSDAPVSESPEGGAMTHDRMLTRLGELRDRVAQAEAARPGPVAGLPVMTTRPQVWLVTWTGPTNPGGPVSRGAVIGVATSPEDAREVAEGNHRAPVRGHDPELTWVRLSSGSWQAPSHDGGLFWCIRIEG